MYLSESEVTQKQHRLRTGAVQITLEEKLCRHNLQSVFSNPMEQ